jgi:hypothetical protein
VGGQQRVLQGVQRLLTVAERPDGDRVQTIRVALHQLLEGVGVTGREGAQERAVVLGRPEGYRCPERVTSATPAP